ncbi:MAG TPA: tetratricopeptide repeat protein [Burkholderiales bacterium]|nr:tetratricopeptide repeat protein [Burkholderiales bacterium]
MRQLACYLAAAAALLAGGGTALAAGGGDSPNDRTISAPADPVIEQAQEKFRAKDYAGAEALLGEALRRNPNSADYHNLYAYAIRKGPNPRMALVFEHYNEALRLDPKHRGAHEYLGEAYLMVGNLDKAKEHLRILDDLCTFGCPEYTMLKDAVAAYEAKAKR